MSGSTAGIIKTSIEIRENGIAAENRKLAASGAASGGCGRSIWLGQLRILVTGEAMAHEPPETGKKDAARDEQIRLRRLRRRAVKLGTLGMRIEKPGVRLFGTERRLDPSYRLIDNSTNAAVCPQHASGHATLDDIEAAIVREAEKERVGK